jgi:hypothetical protein
MALLAGMFFDGATTLTDAHDNLQTRAGNATWVNEFRPIVEAPKRHIAVVLLWLFHQLSLCCIIVGDFAMYIGGKLASRPNLVTIYIAYHPQRLFPEISVLLQVQSTPAFSFGSLDFLFMPVFSTPGDNVYYTVRCGAETVAVIWSTYEYYCKNYAMLVLPSHTSENKILYKRHYKAKIGGEDSRTCRRCVCNFMDPHMFYDFGCHPLL